VAEGGALLRRYGGINLRRGFESLLLRFSVRHEANIGRVGLVCLAVVLTALLVSPLAGALSTAKPDPGSYSGKVGVFPLHFSVSANGKTILGLKTDSEATIDCGSPGLSPPYFTFGPLAINGDSFHGTTKSPDGSSYTITGTFDSATKASGKMNVIFKFRKNALPPCNETDQFAAKRG
jgi:hypothetical protein